MPPARPRLEVVGQLPQLLADLVCAGAIRSRLPHAPLYQHRHRRRALLRHPHRPHAPPHWHLTRGQLPQDHAQRVAIRLSTRMLHSHGTRMLISRFNMGSCHMDARCWQLHAMGAWAHPPTSEARRSAMMQIYKLAYVLLCVDDDNCLWHARLTRGIPCRRVRGICLPTIPPAPPKPACPACPSRSGPTTFQHPSSALLRRLPPWPYSR